MGGNSHPHKGVGRLLGEFVTADGDITRAEYGVAARWRARRDDLRRRLLAGEYGDVASAHLREIVAAGVEIDRAAFSDVWPSMTDEEYLAVYRATPLSASGDASPDHS